MTKRKTDGTEILVYRPRTSTVNLNDFKNISTTVQVQ